MKKFYRIGLLVCASLFSLSVYAATDISCSEAFDGGGVIKGSTKICDQNVALNTFTLGLGDVVYNNKSVKTIYDDFGVHLPEQTEGSFVSSLPLEAVAKALVSIGTLLFLAAFGYRSWTSGVKVMRSGGLEQLARDPQTWKNGGVFALVAALSLHENGLIVGQLAVVYSFLLSIQLTTYVLSSMISVFSFSATANSKLVNSLNQYDATSAAFAYSVIEGAGTALNTAVINNQVYSSIGEIEHLENDDIGSHSGLFGKIASFIDSLINTDDSPVTLSQYVSGKFGDSSVLVYYPTSFDRSYAGINMSLTGDRLPQSAWSSGSDQTNLPFWMHSKNIKDLFSHNYIQKMKVKTGTKNSSDLGVANSVAPLGRMFDNLWQHTSDADNPKFVNDEATRMVSFLATVMNNHDIKTANYTKEDVVNMGQEMALGGFYSGGSDFLSKKNIEKGSTQYYFNPFTARSELSTNNPSDLIYKEAFSAAEHLRGYQCLVNMNQYTSDIMAYYNLRKDVGVDGNVKALLEKDARDVLMNTPFMGQCLTVVPVGNIDGKPRYTYELAFGLANDGITITPDGKKMREALITAIKSAQENGSPEVSVVLGSVSQDVLSQGEKSLATKELVEARKSYKKLSNYYKLISSVGNRVLLQSVQTSSMYSAQQIVNGLRKQGVMAIGSYILQLSNVQKTFSDLLHFGSVDATPVNYTDARTGALPRSDDADWGILEKQLSDYVSTSLSSSLMALKSTAPADKVIKQTGVDAQGDGAEIADSWSSWLADALIPNDADLKRGFGFDEKKDLATSIKECSLTTNCIDFKEHPLATLSLFGRDLIVTGFLFKGVNAVVQAVDETLISGGDTSSVQGAGGSLVGGSPAIRMILKVVGQGNVGVSALIGIFHAVAIMSGIASSLATGFISVGIFFGYIVPFLPMVAILMMGLGWCCEAVLMFMLIPLLLPLAIMNRENGAPLFKASSIVSMYASIILRGPLIFIAFIMFFSLSYGAIYAANSIAFNIISHGGEQSFFILEAFQYLIMFSLLGVLYYASFKTLIDIMVGLPDYVLSHIGVRGISVNVANSFELAVSAKVLSGSLVGMADGLENGLFKKSAQNKRDKQMQEAGYNKRDNEIKERLEKNGHNLNELMGEPDGNRGTSRDVRGRSSSNDGASAQFTPDSPILSQERTKEVKLGEKRPMGEKSSEKTTTNKDGGAIPEKKGVPPANK